MAVNNKCCTINKPGKVPSIPVHETVDVLESFDTSERHLGSDSLAEFKELAYGVALGVDEYVATYKIEAHVMNVPQAMLHSPQSAVCETNHLHFLPVLGLITDVLPVTEKVLSCFHVKCASSLMINCSALPHFTCPSTYLPIFSLPKD